MVGTYRPLPLAVAGLAVILPIMGLLLAVGGDGVAPAAVQAVAAGMATAIKVLAVGSLLVAIGLIPFVGRSPE